MNFQKIELEKNNFLPIEERQGWIEGVYVGKENDKFLIDLPKNYTYNHDFRLQGTNSFVIKNEKFTFTIIGEEVQKSFHLHENEQDNFENSIKEYLDKVFVFLKSNGIEKPENLKLYKVETEKYSWYRANYSYEMSNKNFFKGYNLFGRVLIKIFAGKTLKEKGYEKNKIYREHKIIDFISIKADINNKFFALAYTFDEVSTKDTKEMVITLNEITKSLGYDHEPSY